MLDSWNGFWFFSPSTHSFSDSFSHLFCSCNLLLTHSHAASCLPSHIHSLFVGSSIHISCCFLFFLRPCTHSFLYVLLSFILSHIHSFTCHAISCLSFHTLICCAVSFFPSCNHSLTQFIYSVSHMLFSFSYRAEWGTSQGTPAAVHCICGADAARASILCSRVWRHHGSARHSLHRSLLPLLLSVSSSFCVWHSMEWSEWYFVCVCVLLGLVQTELGCVR